MMPGIVIRKNKAVYWPIPKNACTAIKLHLCNYIGIPAGENPHDAPFEWTDGILPIANDSGDDDWREHYTPELKKIVSNHYREDFIRFGYV